MELEKEGASDREVVVGQTIGSNFRLIKRLGSGAMGQVFEAEQISLGKRVAIKVMRSELMNEPNLIQRFELEARAASALNHPNLIQILDFGRDRSFLFIAMELLAGIDLATILKREGALALERAAWIIDQVLSGLIEAHAHAIVHRDLKPENIILVSRRADPDFVKVCDFGVAKANDRERPNLTMVGLVFGTPEYMSPEQARGTHVDCRSDLYSVATILYELLVGQVPFASGTPVDVMGRQLFDQPLAPSRYPNVLIPAALEALIMRGLAKSADDRPQGAAEFQAELHEALAGIIDRWPGEVARTPLPLVSRAPSQRMAAVLAAAPAAPRKRRKVTAAVAGALTLLTFGGAGAYWLTGWQAAPLLPAPSVTPVAIKTVARPAARPTLAMDVPADDEASDDDAPEAPLLNARPELDLDHGLAVARTGATQSSPPAPRARAAQRPPGHSGPNAAGASTVLGSPTPMPLSAPPVAVPAAPLLQQDTRLAPRPVSDSLD